MKKRPASRLLVLNPENRALLFHFVFEKGALAGQDYWGMPGGGVEAGESFEETAKRELFEETGIQATVEKKIDIQEFAMLRVCGETVWAIEHLYFVRVADSTVSIDRHEPLEREVMKEHKWWSLEELANTSETIFPENIVSLINQQLIHE